jgi:RNA polymerase sigma factor (TIGR02999 family)
MMDVPFSPGMPEEGDGGPGAPPAPVDPGMVTQILVASREDRGALDQLLPLVYEELSRIARRHLRRQTPGHTLNTVALVHEAYLKLVDQTLVSWQDRTHFFATAARAMRQILVDYARRRGAQKRGGGVRPLSLDDVDVAVEEQAAFLIGLDEALTRLGTVNERLAQIVEYRFFGGLTEEETAAALDISDRTVRRDWIKAKAWLRIELSGEPAAGEEPPA